MRNEVAGEEAVMMTDWRPGQRWQLSYRTEIKKKKKILPDSTFLNPFPHITDSGPDPAKTPVSGNFGSEENNEC